MAVLAVLLHTRDPELLTAVDVDMVAADATSALKLPATVVDGLPRLRERDPSDPSRAPISTTLQFDIHHPPLHGTLTITTSDFNASDLPIGTHCSAQVNGLASTAATGQSASVSHLARQGYERGRRPPESASAYVDPHRFATDAMTIKTGVQVNGASATWPFGRLTIDEEWLRLAGTLPPAVWIDRPTVTKVRTLRHLGFRGLMFDTADGRYNGVIVWLGSRSKVLDALAAKGWPVS